MYIVDVFYRQRQKRRRRRSQEQDGNDAHGPELHQNGSEYHNGLYRPRIRVQKRRAEFDQRAHPSRAVHHDAEKKQGRRPARVQGHRDPVAHVGRRKLRRRRRGLRWRSREIRIRGRHGSVGIRQRATRQYGPETEAMSPARSEPGGLETPT